jgi:hypothetical protein
VIIMTKTEFFGSVALLDSKRKLTFVDFTKDHLRVVPKTIAKVTRKDMKGIMFITDVSLYSFLGAGLMSAIHAKDEEKARKLAAALLVHFCAWREITEPNTKFIYADTVCPDADFGTCKPDSHLGHVEAVNGPSVEAFHDYANLRAFGCCRARESCEINSTH